MTKISWKLHYHTPTQIITPTKSLVRIYNVAIETTLAITEILNRLDFQSAWLPLHGMAYSHF